MADGIISWSITFDKEGLSRTLAANERVPYLRMLETTAVSSVVAQEA